MLLGVSGVRSTGGRRVRPLASTSKTTRNRRNGLKIATAAIIVIRTNLENSMIHVVAIITAKPGQRDNILEAFRANIPAVRAEDGCIEYGPTIDTEGMGSFQTK